MATNANNKQEQEWAAKTKPVFFMIENIVVVIVLAGIGMKLAHIPGYGVVLILSMSLLMCIYLPIGFITGASAQKPTDKTLTGISGLGAGIGILGILFNIMHYPGPGMYLDMGIAGLFVPAIYFILNIQSDYVKANRRMLIRTVVLLAVCIAMVARVAWRG